MARGLGLDFASRQTFARPWQVLLLAIGIASLAWVAFLHQQASDQHAAIQAQVDRLGKSHAARKSAPRKDPLASARQAAEARAMNRLELPWDSVLVALQSARPKNVALLSLDVDGSRGQITLTAEAEDEQAMLTFYETLQTRKEITQVILTRHGYREDRAAVPLRFSIGARWVAVQEVQG